jgi:GNAT superfamily N-acetyltransferase
MEVASAGLFEEFDDSASARGKRVLPEALRVRPAEVSDSDAVGRISAERENEIASEHAAGFRRELEIGSTEGTFMIFVAELDGQVIGFGRTRYLDEEHGAVVGESPAGWYLNGVVVDPQFRRRGVGSRLTAERLTWISERSRFAYYFANARNRVSIALAYAADELGCHVDCTAG